MSADAERDALLPNGPAAHATTAGIAKKNVTLVNQNRFMNGIRMTATPARHAPTAHKDMTTIGHVRRACRPPEIAATAIVIHDRMK
jgi:hypothetical protein